MSDLSRRSFLKASTTLAALASVPAGGEDTPGQEGFLAGVAVRDITPAPGLDLWGYSDRTGPATGTLDPLYAKTIVFRAGDETAAIVVLDLGCIPTEGGVGCIRDRARKAGVSNVIVTATHTHHAPNMQSKDAPHIQAIERAIGDCIEEAMGSLAPARIGVTRAEADVAHNRRLVSKDGQCRMLWRNEERRPTEPVDKEMGIVRVDRLDGRPIAVLVNFACHPVVMGPSNLEYSADYCGEMARIVQEEAGAPCLFLQGACGNINPYLDKTPIGEGGVEAMRGTGRACAQAVLDALRGVETVAPMTPLVRYSEKPVVVGARFDLDDPAQMAVIRAVYGTALDPYLRFVRPDLAVPLGVLVLNNETALAFMPGEMFVQYQLALKQTSALWDTFLCGYANEFHGYFPTIRDAAAGGYGGLAATYVGVGAGDRLVLEAAAEIGMLSGRLKSLYEPKDFIVLDA